MQNRFRSKTAWMSVFLLIGFILKNYYQINMPNYNELIDLIMSVLIGFGIFNNPTDGKGY